MKTINKSDYSEIKYSVMNSSVHMVWQPESRRMSEWEFWEEIDTLFSAAEVFKSKVLYIDAFDFCFPIGNKSLQQIKEQFDKCDIKLIGIVLSSNLLGRLNILKLVKAISLLGVTLTTFKTRDEGEFWVSLKNQIA